MLHVKIYVVFPYSPKRGTPTVLASGYRSYDSPRFRFTDSFYLYYYREHGLSCSEDRFFRIKILTFDDLLAWTLKLMFNIYI